MPYSMYVIAMCILHSYNMKCFFASPTIRILLTLFYVSHKLKSESIEVDIVNTSRHW